MQRTQKPARARRSFVVFADWLVNKKTGKTARFWLNSGGPAWTGDAADVTLFPLAVADQHCTTWAELDRAGEIKKIGTVRAYSLLLRGCPAFVRPVQLDPQKRRHDPARGYRMSWRTWRRNRRRSSVLPLHADYQLT